MSLLDFFLSSCPIVSVFNNPIIPIDFYHPPLYINYYFQNVSSSLPLSELSYDWIKGDYRCILYFLGAVN